MPSELASILPLLFEDLPPEVIAEPDRERLKKITSGLPLASGGLIEIPLTTDGGPVGLGICLTQKQGGLAALEDPQRNFHARPVARPIWEAIQNFVAARKEAGSNLRRGVAEGWLEFDIDAKTRSLPAPNFFFKLERPFNRPATAGTLKQAHQHSSLSLIQKGLEALGVSISEASQATLSRCIRARNASTSIAYVGVMLARKTASFRLTLGGMHFYDLMAYLRKIEYPYGTRSLLPLLDIVSRHMSLETLALHLDIDGGTIQPQLGLEVSMNTDANPAGAWRGLLEQLTYAGVCTADRARGLPSWYRQFHRNQMREAWPEALGLKHTGLYCTINHVKFSYQPGTLSQNIPAGASQGTLTAQTHAQEITAKAYLAYQYASGLPYLQVWSAATN